jgi:anti-anti-sigma factor
VSKPVEIEREPLEGFPQGLVVRPAGPVKAKSCAAFRDSMGAMVDEATQLVIDFGRVEYIDSSTAGFLLKLHDQMGAKGGALALVNLPANVRVVVDSLGLTSFFTVCDTIEEARAALALEL